MRPIDADAMRQRIVIEVDTEENRRMKNLLLEWMDKQPTIDPNEPVSPKANDQHHWYCGACGCRLRLKLKPRYCHKCGRKIDWERGEKTKMLTTEEIESLVAFIKRHEREDIPDDVWDACMKLMDFLDEQ